MAASPRTPATTPDRAHCDAAAGLWNNSVPHPSKSNADCRADDDAEKDMSNAGQNIASHNRRHSVELYQLEYAAGEPAIEGEGPRAPSLTPLHSVHPNFGIRVSLALGWRVTCSNELYVFNRNLPNSPAGD
jgi:hypothetical protein